MSDKNHRFFLRMDCLAKSCGRRTGNLFSKQARLQDRACRYARLGVVSCAAAKVVRNAQTIRNHLDNGSHSGIRGRSFVTLLGKFSAAFHVGFMEVNKLKNKLLALGMSGTILAILCCFIPLLPIVLTALGLTGQLGVVYSDAVLLPILAGFLILTGYAIWQTKKQK